MIPFSVLDLSPIVAGGSAGQSLANTLDLARHAERLGFNRYWLAEHHNMPGIASAATAVVIAHVAAGTSTIRVGSGGVMLPNHSPLVIAEQFGTLESLHPGRIDLGLGRAPGTDQFTAQALRRDVNAAAEHFPDDVLELQTLLGDPQPGQHIRAVPGTGTHVPLWILGSSLYGAQLAAMLGLPYSFASHFAPDALTPALEIYRERFAPSPQLDKPYAMPALQVVARRHRRRGAPPVHLHPAGLRQHAAQRARTAARADRRHRGLLVAGRAGAGDAHADLRCGRLAGEGARGPEALHRIDGRRRADDRRPDSRPRRAGAVVRDRGGSDERPLTLPPTGCSYPSNRPTTFAV